MKKSYGKITLVGLIGIAVVSLAVAGVVAVKTNNSAEAQVPGGDTAQFRRGFQYAAKFVCGLVEGLPGEVEGPVKPGNYATAINIHSPQHNLGVRPGKNIVMLKKAVIAFPEPEQGRPSEMHEMVLLPDGATEADCPEIRQILDVSPNQFIKGFFVIYATDELDVVGVYTSQSLFPAAVTFPSGMSIDVEQIPGRRM